MRVLSHFNRNMLIHPARGLQVTVLSLAGGKLADDGRAIDGVDRASSYPSASRNPSNPSNISPLWILWRSVVPTAAAAALLLACCLLAVAAACCCRCRRCCLLACCRCRCYRCRCRRCCRRRLLLAAAAFSCCRSPRVVQTHGHTVAANSVPCCNCTAVTATLLHGAAAPRQCTFHWHDSSLTHDGEGLAAVHCGDHKAHFSTQVRHLDLDDGYCLVGCHHGCHVS